VLQARADRSRADQHGNGAAQRRTQNSARRAGEPAEQKAAEHREDDRAGKREHDRGAIDPDIDEIGRERALIDQPVERFAVLDCGLERQKTMQPEAENDAGRREQDGKRQVA
jgi:hypothetical protein